jgi:soluble lytic murein transglycosylase-like protein
MPDLKTSRPFQERFLDGYDRTQLRQEVQKVKPMRSSLRKKYATWALGASLALGGIGIPMKSMMHAGRNERQQTKSSAAADQPPTAQQIAGDLQTAKKIAQEVSGGVRGAVNTVADVAVAAPAQVAQQIEQAPKQLVNIAENVKENFFKREVPFGSIIYSEAMKNDLPPELVAAVAHTESKFIPTARSHAGAVGLMQLVPRTGRWLGARDLTNPAQNIMAGTKYLKYLSERFNGNQEKIIAAYNAGEGNVRRFGGVPPFRETRSYVQKVRSFQRDLGSRMESHVAELGTAQPGM